jgi:hypothetical protein
MVMPSVTLVVMVAVVAVSAALGLEGNPHFYKICAEGLEHILDHMVRPNAKNLVSNFSRQMPISEMPGKAHKLFRIFMPDFYNRLRCGLNLEPSPIVKLQAIAVCHRDRFREVEKDIFALIRSQPNAAAMASVKIESENARRRFLRPQPGGSMN